MHRREFSCKKVRCYVDLGSGGTSLRKAYADKFNLTYFDGKFDPFTGYGGQVTPIGAMTKLRSMLLRRNATFS